MALSLMQCKKKGGQKTPIVILWFDPQVEETAEDY